ncbi:transporter substrate-binding protein [Trichocoleus sp. FACHB-262]|uniref:transporter substrate-binding protein n=1 Tax=Trichocoleus sp. FACHB-262 TaxID=2692869 RepID=UPI0018EF5EE9|nr:transporter substrate-binding protein [Trichocoleus sp. FACHB-262]
MSSLVAQRTMNPPDGTVRVGILHSLSGPLAISESSLKDAALMAIAEINQAGGVLGQAIVPVVEDSASDPYVFEQKARKLLKIEQVVTLFGGWSSTGRKLVLPVLEEFDRLLWYPVQYEGLECSKYIFYTGACPNQQVEPAVNWLFQHQHRRFYLLGMDYVFPRVANKIIKARLKQLGGMTVGEAYPALETTDYRSVIEQIKQARPDVVFSTLNGNGNVEFYQQYHAAGISAAEIPIMAVSVTEDELQRITPAAMAGHYATWSYFQSIDSLPNQAFVQRFKTLYGAERVTSDPVEAAYSQVYLWKQAVETAESFETHPVRCAAYGQTLIAPSGFIQIEPNHHVWKSCRIGEILPTGQFQSLYVSERSIKPQPWFGVDESDLRDSALILDLLAEVPQVIQYSCQLERKSRELEVAMAELVNTNQHLQQAKNQLLELTKREELLKRRLSIQIRSTLELETIVRTAVQEIHHLFEIDRCEFLWYNQSEEAARFKLAHEVSAPHLTHRSLPPPTIAVEVLGEILLKLSPLWIDNIATAPQLDTRSREALTDLGLVSLLAIAIYTNSGQIGAIVCEHYSGSRSWSTDEVELLQDVADQLAIAIDQAELYAQSRATAAAAQAQAQQLTQALAELRTTQTQLIQTEKMSSLGQLVAGIAHEINNPVNFIYGNLSYANEYTQDLLKLIDLYQQHYPEPALEIQQHRQTNDFEFLVADLPKMLSSMRVGADRIRQIVLSLRNFSRLDESEMKPVNIHEGIDSTLLILQNRFKVRPGSQGIEVIKQYGDLPQVECYAGQLNQVFMNILSNAIDALDSQSEAAIASGLAEPAPTITIRTEVLHPERVTVRIQDNGPGMTAFVVQRLFDPFFTTKPVGQGTGLGLSISYQIIVEKHRGTLWCNTQPGTGAEFWIEIPISQSAPFLVNEAEAASVPE